MESQLKDVVLNTELADPATADVFVDKEKTDEPAFSLVSRVYHGFMVLLFLVGTFMGIISLGLFGVKYAQVVSFARQRMPGTSQVCILFAKTKQFEQELSGVAVCGFVLSVHAAIILLALACLIYNIVLTIIGPRILSPLRILDFAVVGIGLVFSFTVSVVVHAGLNGTCGTFDVLSCSQAVIENGDRRVEFYNEINSSKAILWILTIGCILLSLLNGLLVIVYCIRASNQRHQEKLETYNPLEEEGGDQTKSDTKEYKVIKL